MSRRGKKWGPTALYALLEELGLELRHKDATPSINFNAEIELCNRLDMYEAWPQNNWHILPREHPQQQITDNQDGMPDMIGDGMPDMLGDGMA